MGKRDCGHDHSGDPLAALTCETAGDLVENANQRIGCAVVALPIETDEGPSVSLFGNTASITLTAQAILESVSNMPRPTHCENCQLAHDRAVLALSVLQPENEKLEKMC